MLDANPQRREMKEGKDTAVPRRKCLMHIIDARGQLAATGNKAKGFGVESMDNYNLGGHIWHMSIDNIHSMRASWKSLAKLVHGDSAGSSVKNWLSNIEKTNWIFHVSQVDRRQGLLIHCTLSIEQDFPVDSEMRHIHVFACCQ